MKNDEQSEQISDRTLERLRLGELSDVEAAEVMSRLEERGETARLDERIAYDEAFLSRYPAGIAASQIRELARRRQRKQNGDSVGSMRARPLIVLGALVAVFVVVLVSVFLSEPPVERSRDLAKSTNTAADAVEDEEKPERGESVAGVAKEIQSNETDQWLGMLPWLLEHSSTAGAGAMGCAPGETISFDAAGISRVTTDRSELLKIATEGDDEKRLQIRCAGSGTATLSVFFGEDEPPRIIIFRVAPEFYERPRAKMEEWKRLKSELGRCGELKAMELHVLLNSTGRPEMAMVGGGTEEERACVRETALEFRATPGDLPDNPPYLLMKIAL